MIFKVQKRTGEIVDFNSQKIQKAIWAATQSIDGKDESISQDITSQIIQYLDRKFTGKIPTVEEIQDGVEKILTEKGHYKTVKSYILYREKRAESRTGKQVMVNVENTISEYLNKLDWRVNANSNQGYSLGGMILNTSGKVTANYWLSHIYSPEIGNAHRNGDYHIHDLDMFAGYCAGWSLRTLLEEGFNGVSDKIESAPPKHLSTAVSQMVNFLGTLQNEWAGAQAFSSFDTYMAPFVKKYELEIEAEIKEINPGISSEKLTEFVDKKTYDYVLQNMQSFVFNLNVPSRWGTQTPFTNITLDWTCPDDLKNKRLLLGGKPYEYTFGELQKERNIINRTFIEVMTKGDEKGRVFTFPIPTYNITSDFEWENPNTEPLFEMTAKYGMPYFQNFINSDMDPSQVRSMCCRLQLDLKELLARGGGLFGSAEMTGSIGVVTISLPRIGYKFKGNEEEFFTRIGHLMFLAKTSLEIKRKEIQKWIDRGLFPYTKRYLKNLNNHFSTIGLNGMNEAVRNFTNDKHDITDEWGQDFAEKVLNYMREKLVEFQEETGNLYNLEATPAEGTTYRFAKEDLKRFPQILQSGTPEAPYYSNSSQLPVEFSDDAFEALKLQEKLQGKYTGGTVFHTYMGERISNAESCKQLVKKILTQFRIPYVTITPTFSICPKHGYLEGEHDYCPKCDAELGLEKAVDTEIREKHDSRRQKTVPKNRQTHSHIS